MQMKTVPTTAPAPLDFYAKALHEIDQRTDRELSNLQRAKNDIERFEALCGVLREHGLEFSSRVYASEWGIQYWINLHEEHLEHAADMLLTLARLECEQKTQRVEPVTETTDYTITGEHAPDFTLSIHTPALRAKENGGPGWAAVEA